MKRPRNSADDAKVAQCLNLKGGSNDALRKILGRLGESQPSRNKVHVLQQEHFSQVKEVLKLPCLDGTEMNWEVANPSTLVSHSARHSKEMERAFAQALQWHPCSVEKPWRLAVTFDEFTPGNVLRPNNSRKTMVANFSFLELDAFGDNTWWTMAVARTSTINNIDGGWSRMLRDLLRLSLGPPSGMQVAGIPMMVAGQHTTIFAKLALLLSDGEGLRQALQWNGAASNKPCFRHWNVVRRGSTLGQAGGKYVCTRCSDPSLFKVLAEADLHSIIDVTVEAQQQFNRGEIAMCRLKDIQKTMGFKATDDGLLADPQLRSYVQFMEVVRYDWAHTFLADSMLGRDLWTLVEAAEKHRVFTQEDIERFLRQGWSSLSLDNRGKAGACMWAWRHLSKIFSKAGAQANEAANTIKASMSDLLTLYRSLSHFFATRVPAGGPLDDHMRLFQLVGKAVDLILAVKHRRLPQRHAGQQLVMVLRQHMDLLRVLGVPRNPPKLHWAFDVAECLLKDDFLVDAFALERLHLRVKDIAALRCDLGVYEKSVIAGVTNRHLSSMLDEDWASPCRLLGNWDMPAWAPSIRISKKAQFYGEFFIVGAYVCRGCCWVGCQVVSRVGGVWEIGWANASQILKPASHILKPTSPECVREYRHIF